MLIRRNFSRLLMLGSKLDQPKIKESDIRSCATRSIVRSLGILLAYSQNRPLTVVHHSSILTKHPARSASRGNTYSEPLIQLGLEELYLGFGAVLFQERERMQEW